MAKGNSPKGRNLNLDRGPKTGAARRRVGKLSLVNGNTMKPKSPTAGSAKPPKARGQKFG